MDQRWFSRTESKVRRGILPPSEIRAPDRQCSPGKEALRAGPEAGNATRLAGGVCLRATGDQIRQLGVGGRAAELGQPRQSRGVERVSGQQPQVRLHARERARLAVVELVALANRL